MCHAASLQSDFSFGIMQTHSTWFCHFNRHYMTLDYHLPTLASNLNCFTISEWKVWEPNRTRKQNWHDILGFLPKMYNSAVCIIKLKPLPFDSKIHQKPGQLILKSCESKLHYNSYDCISFYSLFRRFHFPVNKYNHLLWVSFCIPIYIVLKNICQCVGVATRVNEVQCSMCLCVYVVWACIFIIELTDVSAS